MLCNVEGVEEDRGHALLSCDYNQGTGDALFMALSSQIPNLQTDKLLLLDIGDTDQIKSFSAAWIISNYYISIWEKRSKEKY